MHECAINRQRLTKKKEEVLIGKYVIAELEGNNTTIYGTVVTEKPLTVKSKFGTIFRCCDNPHVVETPQFFGPLNASEPKPKPINSSSSNPHSVSGKIIEMAKKYAPDYPEIEECSIYEQLYAIESSLEGTDAANKECHMVIKYLLAKLNMSKEELVEKWDSIVKRMHSDKGND